MLAKITLIGLCIGTPWLLDTCSVLATEAGYAVRQISFGPRHHFFGYIGHVGTVPWNASGRYLVALSVGSEDHRYRQPKGRRPAWFSH